MILYEVAAEEQKLITAASYFMEDKKSGWMTGDAGDSCSLKTCLAHLNASYVQSNVARVLQIPPHLGQTVLYWN